MSATEHIYRLLQQHLDRQPVGFPAVRSKAEIRLLKRLFTENEAALALNLSYRPAATETVVRRFNGGLGLDAAEEMLEAMFRKGAIARKEVSGTVHWYLVPLVIGMYEFQDGAPSVGFLRDAGDYMNTLGYARSLLAVRPSQMRTIPVNRSICAEHHIASHERVHDIVAQARPPFVVLDCICRRSAKLRRQRCKKTKRKETCLSMGSIAAGVLRRGHGREITREEALTMLSQSEEEGLVFQPSGVREPEFICSCCGCCCGMLGLQKKLPRPVDFWTSSFYAEVQRERCIRCKRCVSRCQVEALCLSPVDGKAEINLNRCIGCGLCVSTCPPKAMRLVRKPDAVDPPKDEQTLFEEIKRNRPSRVGEWLILARAALGFKSRA